MLLLPLLLLLLLSEPWGLGQTTHTGLPELPPLQHAGTGAQGEVREG